MPVVCNADMITYNKFKNVYMYTLFQQVGSKASVPVESIFAQLTATVVLPLMIGQWLRRLLIGQVDIKSIPWGQIGR